MKSVVVFVTGSMGFCASLSSKERWMESQQVFFSPPMRTCLPFVCNSFFANVKFLTNRKKNVMKGNRKWNEEEINFVFRSGRCVNTCRCRLRHDCVLAPELSPFLCAVWPGEGRFPSTEILQTPKRKWN